MTWRLSGKCAAAAIFFAASMAVSAPPASADAAPFDDPQSTGAVTLCDVQGHVATHGDIHTKPFVWRAVGSTAAPGRYVAPGRTAALYGFQPIKGLDPQQWNGEYLTFSAAYSSTTRPMAGATAADPSLADLLADYPTKWDGLLQLRLVVGAPGLPGLASPYSTATIKISHDKWTLVEGGHSGCDSGTTRSGELALSSVAALPTPAPNATTDVPTSPGNALGNSGAGSGGASPVAASGANASADAGGASNTAASSSHSSSGLSWWVWGALACAALAAAVVARLIFFAPARQR